MTRVLFRCRFQRCFCCGEGKLWASLKLKNRCPFQAQSWKRCSVLKNILTFSTKTFYTNENSLFYKAYTVMKTLPNFRHFSVFLSPTMSNMYRKNGIYKILTPEEWYMKHGNNRLLRWSKVDGFVCKHIAPFQVKVTYPIIK